MTDAPAAVRATFADYKRIRGRKVGQLILEVPLEKLHEAIASLGGEPSVNQETWCAIARLQPSTTRQQLEASVEQEKTTEKERRAWATLTPTMQAGIRCADPVFQAYVVEQRNFNEVEGLEKNAACFVRRQCNVNTRAALATNEKAATVWKSIDSDFSVWKLAENMG